MKIISIKKRIQQKWFFVNKKKKVNAIHLHIFEII